MVVQQVSTEFNGAMEFLHPLNGANGRLDEILQLWKRALLRGRGIYALCLGSSETSDVEGISAAGADGPSRRLTPAVDAEALVFGRPVSSAGIPVSPEGIVSPVVISRAMLGLIDASIQVFDCGTFVAPKVDAITLGGMPARRLDSGRALDRSIAARLFDRGRMLGRQLPELADYIVVGECIPAGTTSAQAVLTGLGYPAADLVSSSMRNADREMRSRMVAEGLKNAGIDPGKKNHDPLDILAAVGDPMQAFVCGLGLEASRRIPVVLGGGTQMLAIYALMQAFNQGLLVEHNLAVSTTKWVAFDPFAGAVRLAGLVGAPFAAACPDFYSSRHAGLRAYETGNVKEGVAAGAMMAAAYLSGFSESRIMQAIDNCYEKLVPAVTTQGVS